MKGSKIILMLVSVSFVLYIIFIETIAYKNSIAKLNGKSIGTKDISAKIGFTPKIARLLNPSLRPLSRSNLP